MEVLKHASRAIFLLVLLILWSQPRACAIELYGILNSNGKWVVEPRYTLVQRLGDYHYLAIKMDYPSGMAARKCHASVFDLEGHPVSFDVPSGFTLRNVLIAASDDHKKRPEFLLEIEKNGSAGICEEDGTIIIEAKYWEGFTYGDGYFTGHLGDSDVWVFFDRHGNIMTKLDGKKYSVIGSFNEGVVAVNFYGRNAEDRNNLGSWRTKYLRPDGTELALGEIADGYGFSEGYSSIRRWEKDCKKYYSCFIDKSGKELAHRKFDLCFRFRQGQAIVGVLDGQKIKYGTIDLSGRTIINPQFDQLRCRDTRSYLAETKGQQVIIDRTGQIISNEEEQRKVSAVNARIPDKSIHSIEPFPGRRWLVNCETQKFDRFEWDTMEDRYAEIGKLMAEHNFIGMKRNEVESLIGSEISEESRLEYLVYPGGCTSAGTFFDLQFENGCVKSYSIGPDLNDPRNLGRPLF